ncbi:MAG: dTDP-4-dehydrorhamnose 3,5-epimerase [Chlorobi bacterium]|nr:dTDP-4-dehydrorhamnose 3,5-epimerase [Chlorobiota bacterium]
MKVIAQPFDGCFLLEPRVFEDERGFFYEFYQKKKFREATGLDVDFVQDNMAGSRKYVFRGIHFQQKPYEQAKLVSVVRGSVMDFVVDLRPGSPTFGRWYAAELNEENRRQLFIPKGFGHAYLSLSGDTKVFYKTDEYYHPQYDAGIRFDDPEIGLKLPVEAEKLILSEKDRNLPYLREIFHL